MTTEIREFREWLRLRRNSIIFQSKHFTITPAFTDEEIEEKLEWIKKQINK